MTPASAAAVLASIEIMENEPERIKHLWDMTALALNGFKSAGFDTGKSETPIIPLFIRDDIKALQLTQIFACRWSFCESCSISGCSKRGLPDQIFSYGNPYKRTGRNFIEKITKAAKALEILKLNYITESIFICYSQMSTPASTRGELQ